MIKNLIVMPVLLFALLLSACGGSQETPVVKVTLMPTAESAAPTVTAVVDPCSEANLPGEVTKVNDLMREFDDYSALASSTPQQQLVQVIPPMQEVRRRAESLEVPECLRDLKDLQINHMNTVIEILMTFMSNAQAENVNQGIAQARDLHMQYDVEVARLLGLTLVAPPTANAVSPMAPDATLPTADLSIFNPGPDAVILLSAPDAGSGGVATLDAGFSTIAFGQTADGKWIQVEVPGPPGQKAWVDASLVQVSGQLPVVTP